MTLAKESSWVMKVCVSSAELWVQARGRWVGTGLRSATETVCQGRWLERVGMIHIHQSQRWSIKAVFSGRTSQEFYCWPWKNCPLRVLAAALDKANHTTVSAPCSTVRSLSPIIWWNWGIDVETAGHGGGGKKTVLVESGPFVKWRSSRDSQIRQEQPAGSGKDQVTSAF